MTAAEAKLLLERYVAEIWARKNPGALDAFLAPAYRRHVGRGLPPLNRDGQKELIAVFQKAFPDVVLTVEEVVADRDLICFRSRMRGTHLGAFRGIPATSVEVNVGLLDMIRVEDGLFVEQWGGPDLLDLLRQLGAAPPGSNPGPRP